MSNQELIVRCFVIVFLCGMLTAVRAAEVAADNHVRAETDMKNDKSVSLPALAYEGGTRALTLTPVIGTPRRKYAEVFVPGEEPIEDGELHVAANRIASASRK